MPVRSRYRVVIGSVGTALQFATVPTAPRKGILRRVRATLVAADDPEAALGTTEATELALEIHEGGSAGVLATLLGGPDARSIVLEKPIGQAPVGLTLDIGSGRVGDPALDVDFMSPGDERLRVGVRTNQDVGGIASAVAVVTLTIEPHAA